MWGKHCCVVATGVEEVQWYSQNEQVTWAQHVHSMGTLSACVANMHLLGDLGHAPAMNNLHTLRSLLRLFSVTNTILQTYLYARFMSA